jgi:hypothetical protein
MTIDELEAIAQAATPGPWHWNFDAKGYPGRVGKTVPCEPVEHCGYDSHCIALTYDGNERFDSRANAEHIAAFSPARVLPMLEIVRAAKHVAYSNGFDAALPDKQERLRTALAAFDELEGK